MPGHPCFVVEPSGLVRGHRAESSLVVIHEYLIQNSTCASYTYVLFYLASLQSLRDTMRLRSSALSATRAQRARSACTWGRCVCARASCGAIALGAAPVARHLDWRARLGPLLLPAHVGECASLRQHQESAAMGPRGPCLPRVRMMCTGKCAG